MGPERKSTKKTGMERWLTQSPHASLCLWQWWFPLCEQQYCNRRSKNFKINTKRSSGLTPGPFSFSDSEGCKLDTWGLDDRWNQNSEWEWRWMCERIHTFIAWRHIYQNEMQQWLFFVYTNIYDFVTSISVQRAWKLYKE